ncbi:MAG: sel1 repeat family protein [Magnetococcales bacterium]|nr:sel1 repeat family protein [Magnetococcales bacterium]
MADKPPVSPEAYLEAIHSLANDGNPKAQHNLGAMYLNGQGVDPDPAKAVHWFKLAAKQGITHAQHNLGTLYLKGIGVEQDAKEAVRWFKMAAKQGDPRSQHTLGSLYFEGTGVEADLIQSYHWISRAIDGAPDAFKIQLEEMRQFVVEQMTQSERAKIDDSLSSEQSDFLQ